MLLFITREVAPAPPEKREGVGAERQGGLGSILRLAMVQLFLLGTFTTTTSSFFLLSFHSMYNNSFFFSILSPLFLPQKNYLPDISSLITCFTWQPRQEDSSCFGKASGLQLCQMVSFCLPSIFLSIAFPLAYHAIEILLQEGRSLPGPESGLLPNTRK